MRDSPWQPTLLIRASIALHVLALVAVIADPAQWRWALGAVVINHLLLTAVGLWPRSNWLGPNWTRLPAVATARHEIALTIDDGPDPLVTPQVLDILDRYAAHATFFCVGEKRHAIRMYAGKSSVVAMPWKTTASTTATLLPCWVRVDSCANYRQHKAPSARLPVSAPCFFVPLPACAILFSPPCWRDSA